MNAIETIEHYKEVIGLLKMLMGNCIFVLMIYLRVLMKKMEWICQIIKKRTLLALVME